MQIVGSRFGGDAVEPRSRAPVFGAERIGDDIELAIVVDGGAVFPKRPAEDPVAGRCAIDEHFRHVSLGSVHDGCDAGAGGCPSQGWGIFGAGQILQVVCDVGLLAEADEGQFA